MRMVGLVMWMAGMVLLGHANDTEKGGVLAKVKETSVASFKLSGARLVDVARELSFASDVGICAEEVAASDEGRGMPGLSAIKTFSFEMEKPTVEQVLDEIVEEDHRYIWEVDEDNKLINIRPREGGTLDWSIPDLIVEKKTLEVVFITEDALRLRDHGVRFLCEPDASFLEAPVSEKSGEVSARVALNILCGPFGLIWRVYQRQPGEGYILEVESYHRWRTVGG